ncbi:unnamed protein product [Ceutorhynchus assimilis]|uniref:L-Fucosyltransferase n=1 Tax=Ceutorhynchus assimilis TaxID=467358 RepID=A0A9N9MQ34_9CUCU|nr:unnamed protein product [Ceutorhynchus assimilis]
MSNTFKTIFLLMSGLTLFYTFLPTVFILDNKIVRVNITGEPSISESSIEVLKKNTYWNLEKMLCLEDPAIDSTITRFKLSEMTTCPKSGIVSIYIMGRTGNQMWEYASVWAVARRTGLEPYIPRCIKLKLDQIFEQLSVPAFEEIAHCPVEFNTFVKSIEEWNFTNQSIILPRYTLKPKLVLTWVQDIIQEFRFRKKLREKSQQILTSLLRKLPPRDYTFVGVHVRRTDYVGYLKRKYDESPVTKQFFINAMAYYKNKYRDCLFVFLSDDPNWCYQHFGRKPDVYVASYKTKNTPALDLALMAACNHSIFDYGTFGEWGSILAGGETVYSNMTQNIKKGTGRIMKNWMAMD